MQGDELILVKGKLSDDYQKQANNKINQLILCFKNNPMQLNIPVLKKKLLLLILNLFLLNLSEKCLVNGVLPRCPVKAETIRLLWGNLRFIQLSCI